MTDDEAEQSAANKEPNLKFFGLADPMPIEGKTVGYVKIPYSTDASALGFIALPIAFIANGDGPTILLMAGAHGDEFEGQVALSEVIQTLDPSKIRGRVIVLPVANPPAAIAGTRTSPIDALGLSRTFPGDIRGTPTSMIAEYIEGHLMAECEVVVDLHSGGKSLRYMPSVAIMDHPDPSERAKRLSLAFAFGIGSLLVWHGYEERNSSGAAKRAGAVRIAAEIGGGGELNSDLVKLTYDGVMNVLAWTGILKSHTATVQQNIVARDIAQDRDSLFALSDGLFVPAMHIGAEVKLGDLAGYLYDQMAPWLAPQRLHFPAGGTIISQRVPGLAKRGDCLMQVAEPLLERYPNEIDKVRKSNWLVELYSRRRPRIRREKSPATK